MVSMKDLANICGVSVATVSKALNSESNKDVSSQTRQRIRQAAMEAGYFPNAAARTLKTNRSYNIGVLFADAANSGLTHDFFAAVLEAFKFEAERRGYDITFIKAANNSDDHRSFVEKCRYRSLDGVVIACIDFTTPDAIELMKSDIPTVTIDYVTSNCTSVVSDNMAGMKALVEYVVAMGHTKVAYIHGDEFSSVTKTRLAAFYRTMSQHGIEVPDEYVIASKYLDIPAAAKATKQLISLETPPTCILYPDDTAVLGGYNYLKDHGLKIGESISIAGFDGLKVSKYFTPTLTTVCQDTHELGTTAAEDLIRQIEAPKTATLENIVVPTKLIKGETIKNLNY